MDLILLAMAFVKISSKIKFMPYIELTLDGIWILFYLIAANIIIKHVKWSWTLVISVFCGYVAMMHCLFLRNHNFQIQHNPMVLSLLDLGLRMPQNQDTRKFSYICDINIFLQY